MCNSLGFILVSSHVSFAFPKVDTQSNLLDCLCVHLTAYDLCIWLQAVLYHCSFTENQAYGKPTFQSGTTYRNGESSKAVDGKSDTHFRYGDPVGSCTMTRLTNNPWWRVNLQQVQYVSEVYIVNRGSECGCPDRFKNFEIRVGMLFLSNQVSVIENTHKNITDWSKQYGIKNFTHVWLCPAVW